MPDQYQLHCFGFLDLRAESENQMGGFEAVKILREQGYKGKIIALTADAMKGNREKCLEAGFDDFLTKPINRKLVEKTIQDHIYLDSYHEMSLVL